MRFVYCVFKYLFFRESERELGVLLVIILLLIWIIGIIKLFVDVMKVLCEECVFFGEKVCFISGIDIDFVIVIIVFWVMFGRM